MRILFANDGSDDAGGVRSYVNQVVPGLVGRGHELSFLHNDKRIANALLSSSIPYFGVREEGIERVIANVREWRPDVCFSHNMNPLDIEARLLNEVPVVKFMHGYFGTCIGGQKMYSFPHPQPCTRKFGAKCLALYLPRRCGSMRLGKMTRQYLWASRQKALFSRYAAVIVSSQHMKQEYVRNGIDKTKLHVTPLFPATLGPDLRDPKRPVDKLARSASVLFLGRMTRLKGGDFLIRAISEVRARTGQQIRVVMAGDGPQRAGWEQLAEELNVAASFKGWIEGEDRCRLFEEASFLVVPSIWPEPFGLVGLEAASAGIPAIAFDVGGIREWLKDGVNGYLAAGNPPTHFGLAEALIKAFRSQCGLRRLSKRAREVAREMSLKRHLDELEHILLQASSDCHETAA